ncbi:MAG: glycerophosphodiester phosphodiesterase [Microthrixaceae bacterium]
MVRSLSDRKYPAMVPSHPFYNQEHPLAIAHRGGTEAAPENTLAAFTAATSLGYRHLETDVHLTADGVLIAFHDDQLDRVTNEQGKIGDLPWEQIRQARIDGSDPIPTLAELLESFPHAFFNIDAKSDAAVDSLAKTLHQHAAVGRACVAAFSHKRLRRLRELLGSEQCTAASPREVAQLMTAARLRSSARPAMVDYHCVQVPVRQNGIPLLTQGFVRTVHDRGCQVHAWTINDRTEMHSLLDLGVDGIITDFPSELRAVLIEREQWQ